MLNIALEIKVQAIFCSINFTQDIIKKIKTIFSKKVLFKIANIVKINI